MWVCFPPSAHAVFKGHLGTDGDRNTGSNGGLSDANGPPSHATGNDGTEYHNDSSGALWGAISAREVIDIMETMEMQGTLGLTPPPLSGLP